MSNVEVKETEEKTEMKRRLDEALDALGIKDPAGRKEAAIRTAAEHANGANRITDLKISLKDAINELTFMERVRLQWPVAVLTATAVVGTAVLATAIGGKGSEEVKATDTSVGSDANPFASTEPVKTNPRSLKSAAI